MGFVENRPDMTEGVMSYFDIGVPMPRLLSYFNGKMRGDVDIVVAHDNLCFIRQFVAMVNRKQKPPLFVAEPSIEHISVPDALFLGIFPYRGEDVGFKNFPSKTGAARDAYEPPLVFLFKERVHGVEARAVCRAV